MADPMMMRVDEVVEQQQSKQTNQRANFFSLPRAYLEIKRNMFLHSTQKNFDKNCFAVAVAMRSGSERARARSLFPLKRLKDNSLASPTQYASSAIIIAILRSLHVSFRWLCGCTDRSMCKWKTNKLEMPHNRLQTNQKLFGLHFVRLCGSVCGGERWRIKLCLCMVCTVHCGAASNCVQ